MIGAVRELAVHWRADRGSASVNVGVLSPATVLPLAEFEESTVETVYQFVFDGRRAPKTPRRVFYDMLPSSNGVLLFGVEERNCAEIEQELGEVHYFSPFSGLLQWMAGRKQTARQRRIFVHCRSTQIDVAYFEGHRIFAFNTFDVQTADDVLYFTCQLARAVWCGFFCDALYHLWAAGQDAGRCRMFPSLCGGGGMCRCRAGIRWPPADRIISTSI